jgi:hypothetical protein
VAVAEWWIKDHLEGVHARGEKRGTELATPAGATWREGRANAEAVHAQETVVAASRGMVVGDLRRTALVHGRADTRGWKLRRRFQGIECLAST